MELDSLITTIVTSTAALIAIIGGFLVSRVISLSSEQNGIKRRVREIDGELEVKKYLKDEIEDLLFHEDADSFIASNIKELFDDNIDLKTIIDNDHDNQLTYKQLIPFVRNFKNIRDEMISKVDSLWPPEEIDLDDFLKENKLKLIYPMKKEWYEWVYNELHEKWQDQLPPIERAMSLSTTSNIGSSHYEDSVKKHESIMDEISLLEKHRTDQINILKDYGQPHGVLGGIIVLGYASIVGIVIPSIFLPYSNAITTPFWDKWILLSLFFSQLAALFIYLGYQVHKLSNLDDEKSTSN